MKRNTKTVGDVPVLIESRPRGTKLDPGKLPPGHLAARAERLQAPSLAMAQDPDALADHYRQRGFRHVPTIGTLIGRVNVPSPGTSFRSRKSPERLVFALMDESLKDYRWQRFDPSKIGKEIDRVRKLRRLTVKQAAAIIGCPRTGWYKKRDLDGSAFHMDDIDRLAAEWDAPPGWPFISWDLATAFAAWLRAGSDGQS
jgi:hypothetical protein